MKIGDKKAFAVLALLGLWTSSSASGPLEWQLMREPGQLYLDAQMQEWAVGHVSIEWNFRFTLPEGSDGIYPASEVVEIEVAGGLDPDDSEGSALVISIPIGSFRESHSGFFWTWNPPGLMVNQRYGSYDWDFVDSGGVEYFWAYIQPPQGYEVGRMKVLMRIRDNRPDDDPGLEPTPKFFDLLYGGPTLNIGEDGWESEPMWVRFRAKPYWPPG